MNHPKQAVGSRFGELLRLYRRQTVDPQRGGALTQERVGELIGEKLGTLPYTGAAVSDWERGKSQIHKDDRRVLIALIQALYQTHGLLTMKEADSLLIAGNYRPLDSTEAAKIFDLTPSNPPPRHGRQWRVIIFLLFQSLLDEPSDIPQPPRHGWSGAFLSGLGRITDLWAGTRFFRFLLWLALWSLTAALTSPLLKWPFVTTEQARLAALAYICGALIVPMLIGLITATRGDDFWEQQNLANDRHVRFYAHLGASIGFHVGYMLVFALLLPLYYLGVWPLPNWSIALLLILPLVLSAASAREVPFNQWRAFNRVKLADAWIFSIFFIYPIIWGGYLFGFHELLLDRIIGPLIIGIVILFFGLRNWRNRRIQAKANAAQTSEQA